VSSQLILVQSDLLKPRPGWSGLVWSGLVPLLIHSLSFPGTVPTSSTKPSLLRPRKNLSAIIRRLATPVLTLSGGEELERLATAAPYSLKFLLQKNKVLEADVRQELLQLDMEEVSVIMRMFWIVRLNPVKLRVLRDREWKMILEEPARRFDMVVWFKDEAVRNEVSSFSNLEQVVRHLYWYKKDVFIDLPAPQSHMNDGDGGGAGNTKNSDEVVIDEAKLSLPPSKVSKEPLKIDNNQIPPKVTDKDGFNGKSKVENHIFDQLDDGGKAAANSSGVEGRASHENEGGNISHENEGGHISKTPEPSNQDNYFDEQGDVDRSQFNYEEDDPFNIRPPPPTDKKGAGTPVVIKTATDISQSVLVGSPKVKKPSLAKQDEGKHYGWRKERNKAIYLND